MILASVALAHVPHDTVRALAAPEDLGAASPWLAVADPQDVDLILESTDGGRRWAMTGGEPLRDTIHDATRLSDGTIVLLGNDDTLWSSTDGATWTTSSAPAGAVGLERDGGALIVATPTALWAGSPQALREEVEVAVVSLGEGPMAVDTDGGVLRRQAGSWVPLGRPGRATTVAATGRGGTYAGDVDGGVWRLDGDTWTACGALPEQEVPEIVNLAVGEDAVYVATGTRAPFASTDRCDTWVDRDVGEDTSYGGDGGAAKPADAWPVLAAYGDAIVVGGWAGLFTSEDAGATWTSQVVVPADYTRGVAFGAGFAEDGRIYWGSYGAGPALTADGGRTFSAPGLGLSDANVQRLDVADTGADTVYAVVGHSGWVSRDGGTSWTPFGGDVGDLVAWETPDHVWAMGSDGSVSETTDGGATWTPLDALLEALAGSRPQGTGLVGDRVCVTGSEPVRLVCADGDAWTTLYAGEDGDATDPFERDGRILFGEDAGVRWSDDGGATWSLAEPAPGDPVSALTLSDDGTLFAATLSALLFRSDDGGETWTQLGDRLTAHVYTLVARPDFADHPDLIVGTHDGTWVVHGTDPPARWAGYQRLDTQGALVDCAGCEAVVSDETAGMGGLQPLGPLDTVTAWVRGERIRVLGQSSGLGTLRVDGEDVATIERAEDVLADVTVAPGWHYVEVVGGMDGVSVDALEGYAAATYLTVEIPHDTGDTAAAEDSGDPVAGDDTGAVDLPFRPCGCGRGGAAVLLFPLGLLRRARLRRRSR